jgi:glyoxylase-like metal-dependent hydrolase (beta-lactamase superfamily II)
MRSKLMTGGFRATAAGGFRFTWPRILRPEPGIQVAQGYDFSDLAFITASDGVVAIDAGTTQDRARAALGGLDPPAGGAISHLILTHAHWDHIGGAGALRGPGTRVIAQAGFPAGLDREQGKLHGQVRDGIRDGRTLPDILEQASLPAVLREHPTAVVPYLVTRDHFTERLYHQRTGYWQPDGQGLEPATAAGHAGLTERLAAASARRARRVLAAEVRK